MSTRLDAAKFTTAVDGSARTSTALCQERASLTSRWRQPVISGPGAQSGAAFQTPLAQALPLLTDKSKNPRPDQGQGQGVGHPQPGGAGQCGVTG